MLQEMSRKAMNGMRDGMLEGVDRARDTMGRVQWRTPWTYRKSVGWGSPWMAASLAAASLLVGLAAFLYFRKRRQVADRYTMGTSAESVGTGAVNGYGMETGNVGRPQPA
jgi:hypothetical protein